MAGFLRATAYQNTVSCEGWQPMAGNDHGISGQSSTSPPLKLISLYYTRSRAYGNISYDIVTVWPMAECLQVITCVPGMGTIQLPWYQVLSDMVKV